MNCIIQRQSGIGSAGLTASFDITRLLRAWSSGDQTALEELAPAVYEELCRIARIRMAYEQANATLQPTELVHEAYLRLIDLRDISWQDRAHFFAVCAQMMRRILVDRARARSTAKRGGPAANLGLSDIMEVGSWRADELVALDDALTRMDQMDERKAKVIELRFFAGLSVEETATVLKISPQSVARDWKLARAWLARELGAPGKQAPQPS